MSLRLGYNHPEPTPLPDPQVKNVDKPPQPLGGIAARALSVMETNGPARRSHGDVLKANTGWFIDPAKWAKRAEASERLHEQSESIADALERMGVSARLDADITAIGAITGIAESLPAYRAIRFIPAVAARDRRPTLNAMKYFIAHHPNAKFFRYSVMTAAEPVPFGGALRKSIQTLSRRLSKWAAQARAHDVEILFRGIEFTRATAAERDAESAARVPASFIGPRDAALSRRLGAETVLYHVHANILSWPKRAMASSEWTSFLQMTWRAVKAHWRDNGRVEKVEELVKYCLKPNDIATASDDEIHWLYEQTGRLKLAQPMGPFATFMANLKEDGEKVVRVRHGNDGRLQRVRKSARLDHRDAGSDEDASEGGEGATPVSEAAGAASTSNRPTNLLLGVSLPQWRHTPWSEPLILVQRYDPKAAGAADRERLQDIDIEMRVAELHWTASGAPDRAIAMDVARKARAGTLSERDLVHAEIAGHSLRPNPEAGGEADRYRVHTCRPTVRGTSGEVRDETAVARSRKDEAPPAKRGRASTLPPPDALDDLIPFEAPLSPFVQSMRAMLAEQARARTAIDMAA